MIEAYLKYIVSPEVIFREIDGETVLLDMQSENYFGLDEVASRIWQLICAGSTTRVIYDTLLSEYDVAAQKLEKDLHDCLKYLVTAGLISPA